MSDNQDDVEKKEDATAAQSSQDSTSSTDDSTQKKEQQPKPATQRPVIGTPVNRPRIGTPIGTAISQPASKPVPAQPAPQEASQTQTATPPRPAVGAPVNRPRIGTPVGTPVGKPAAPAAQTPAGQPAPKPATAGSAVARPAIGSPVVSKPTIGTPAGAAPRPSVGTPATSRPAISTPGAARPATPAKPPPSKEEISRRNFMRGIVILGGLVAILQFGGLGPYLQGTVAGATQAVQNIVDSVTSAPITTSSFSDAIPWITFVYPATGNANIDADTFRQCVIIRLPAGFTAPSDVSVTDSSGNIYCGFSRVCVHLWCLWSYVPTDMRMECPCHGSQYVPGSGTYPLLPIADNKPPGLAVEGPASLQVPPNNQLPMIYLKINSDSSFAATGIRGQVGCGQYC